MHSELSIEEQIAQLEQDLESSDTDDSEDEVITEDEESPAENIIQLSSNLDGVIPSRI